MKFLVLAYGDEKDWVALTKEEQDELLAQDAVLRARGDVVAAVAQEATVVRAPNGNLSVTQGPFARGSVPLAGFGIIEAENLEEAIRLVENTPCARAGGAVEIRPVLSINR